MLTSDGKRQWEECNDLINNKGCIKQVVNGGKYSAWSFKDYYYGCVISYFLVPKKWVGTYICKYIIMLHYGLRLWVVGFRISAYLLFTWF